MNPISDSIPIQPKWIPPENAPISAEGLFGKPEPTDLPAKSNAGNRHPDRLKAGCPVNAIHAEASYHLEQSAKVMAALIKSTKEA